MQLKQFLGQLALISRPVSILRAFEHVHLLTGTHMRTQTHTLTQDLDWSEDKIKAQRVRLMNAHRLRKKRCFGFYNSLDSSSEAEFDWQVVSDKVL